MVDGPPAATRTEIRPADLTLAVVGVVTGVVVGWLYVVSILGIAVLVPPLFLAGLVWTFPRFGPMGRRQLALWTGLLPALILTVALYRTGPFY